MAKTKRGPKPKTQRQSRTPKSSNDEALKLEIVKQFSFNTNIDELRRCWTGAYDFIKGIEAPISPETISKPAELPAEVIAESEKPIESSFHKSRFEESLAL